MARLRRKGPASTKLVRDDDGTPLPIMAWGQVHNLAPNRDEIWRVAEAYTINYYENPFLWETLMCSYDLQNGRYLAFGLNNELPIEEFDVALDQADFTPDAIRRMGRR
jgi:hypothetical protein